MKFATAALAFVASASLAASPAAIKQDPPIDRTHPASGQGVQFTSHGERVNAQLYLPAGAGVHRAVILLHGYPGNEQNLDLARAIQRAGWAVVTFHYRGSWGSGGNSTLEGGCDDVDALLADIAADPDKWHIDTKHLVVIGHSYGGFVAACAASRHKELTAVGLIAPWDISYDARNFAKLTAREARDRAAAIFNDVDGRVTGLDAVSLMAAIRRGGSALDLTAYAPALRARPLLIATATRDDPDDQAIGLLEAFKHKPALRMTFRRFDTDHGFNDQRIALETFLLDWLEKLPVVRAAR